jgi:hypothetical protein
MINSTMSCFKVAEIPKKLADIVANVIELQWLIRYPQPNKKHLIAVLNTW